MQKKLLPEAEQYAKQNNRRHIWQKFVRVMACIVVFCTTYALILPAITMEKTLGCGLEEHTHTESCYVQKTAEQVTMLACTYQSLNVHVHTADCYDGENVLQCGYADFLLHTHDASCADAAETIVCQLPEITGHEHTEAECYRAVETEPAPEETEAAEEVHFHDDSCYTIQLGELICEIAETEGHTHTDTCYTQGELLCQLEETEDHTHTPDCYESLLNCGQGEAEAHKHADSCYEQIKTLICLLPEGTTEEAPEQANDSAQTVEPEWALICDKKVIKLHSHTDACYAACLDANGVEQTRLICGETAVQEHIHSDSCYVTVDVPLENTDTVTCGLIETEGHTHTQDCYDESGALICVQQVEAHQHTAMCYGTWELKCTIEVHTHSLACESDSAADVETEENWEASFADVALSGIWAEDLVAIARSQLGYTESAANYIVLEDGETVKGYTRYGAWYGDPYGDWSAMFVSFCLNYAGVENMPLSADCSSWITELADLYCAAEGHEPQSGELVFFDRNADTAPDHVGLVTDVLSGEEETPARIAVIEGDSEDMVQAVTYVQTDAAILGYGKLPEVSTQFRLTAETESGIVVTISGKNSSLPYPADEITVTAVEVVDEEILAARDQLLAEEGVEAEDDLLLDITLWHEGVAIEPVGPVSMTFSGFGAENSHTDVYHIDTENQEVTDMDAVRDAAGNVLVTTDHFSFFSLRSTNVTTISGYLGTNLSEGGYFKLTGDAWTENNGVWADLTIDNDTTIDLNGRTLSLSKSGQYFQVESGATLTITDSSGTITDTESNVSGNLYGNKGSYSDSSLTYYVTESTVNGTSTTETLKKHDVTFSNYGKIVFSDGASSDSAIKVNGGTLDIQGGYIWNASGKRSVEIASSSSEICMSGGMVRGAGGSDNGSGIYVGNGTLNLSGGYIFGGSAGYGGGVYMDNGTINMTGGVIAANHANRGGGIYVNNGTLNISSGAVASNWVNDGADYHGGGVYMNNGTLNLSGTGYITNNYKNLCCSGDVNNWHGGGGVLLATSADMNMSGGYVTGNYSGEAGGGIYAGYFSSSTTGCTFTMTGGTVASNCADEGEGGGIRIAGGTVGNISSNDSKAYITNNITKSPNDWGGGGIFVQENGSLMIQNSLITNNTAGGYGGGVGACPTGETLIVHTDGAAIYGNKANGQNMSGGGNDKNYDTSVAATSSVFTSSGYQDYFCVKESSNSSYISLVTGEMVGGGAANWSGSCDNQEITISKTGHAAAKYLFGLTADPDGDAIAAAQKVAGVIITGNSAYTHGGGIMTNGGLILGKTDTVVTAAPALEIKGTKALTVDGTPATSGLDFTFKLMNSQNEEVGTATSNAKTGEFTISPNVKYEEKGTYTYYLMEYNDSKTGVDYDDVKYQIVVTIDESSVTLLDVTFKSYYVKSVAVSKVGDESSSGSSSGTTSNTFKIHYKNDYNWGTVCLYTWNAGELTSGDWPGYTVDQDPNNSGWYTKEFTVSGTGSFSYIFSNNGDSNAQTGDLSGTYGPGQELWVYADQTSETAAPSGWVGSSGGTTITSSVDVTGTANSDESYTLTFNQAAFTNTKTTLSSLQITKLSTETTENGNPPINNVTFTLTKKDSTESSPEELTTDANGIVTFTELKRGATYTLTETAPAEYVPAGPWEVVVDANGAITINGLTVTQDNTDKLLYTTTIYNSPWGYELPQTGGTGTYVYTMAGLMLMLCSAAYLLYRYQKRRREGF